MKTKSSASTRSCARGPRKRRSIATAAEAKAAAGVADAKPATQSKSAKKAAAPEVAEARPADTKAADPAEPNREAVAETAQDPAGAGADAN